MSFCEFEFVKLEKVLKKSLFWKRLGLFEISIPKKLELSFFKLYKKGSRFSIFQ